MDEVKVVKAKCRKTGKLFAFEMHKQGGEWVAWNMVEIEQAEYDSMQTEVRQPIIHSAANLQSCPRCHTRNIGGCGCAKARKGVCSKSQPYDFGCTYCNELEIDYSRMSGRSPYGQWAGVSNIPGAHKDKYGNPDGSAYDLAQDGAFKGYKIIALNYASAHVHFRDCSPALNRKGFEIIAFDKPTDPRPIQQCLSANQGRCQIWVISDLCHWPGDERVLDLAERAFKEGVGLYIWNDNDPFGVQGNYLAERLFRAKTVGDYPGERILGVSPRPGEPGIIKDHPITTGIVSFYEGVTISHLVPAQALDVLMIDSGRTQLSGFYDKDGCRCIVDGGFTRLYVNWNSAGTDRYVVNAAAWLANVERFGYNPQ